MVYMITTKFNGYDVPLLGFGTMRMPTIPGTDLTDYDASIELIDLAMEKGVNYFDTGFAYMDSSAESFIGYALTGRYPRESFILADKIPASYKTLKRAEEVFELQLKRCRVDYFDFYMLHCVVTEQEVKDLASSGIIDFIMKKKEVGIIKNVGFSFHGDFPTLKLLLGEYNYGWDVIQLQLNYLDWVMKDAKAQYELITSHNIKCITMESTRGGLLVNIPEEVYNPLMESTDCHLPPIKIALDFLTSLPNVLCILSGMNTVHQINQNSEILSRRSVFTIEEQDLLDNIRDFIIADLNNKCTKCNYCKSACYNNIPIPQLLEFYYDKVAHPNFICTDEIRSEYAKFTPNASNCVRCMKCFNACPQHIDVCGIMENLKLQVK